MNNNRFGRARIGIGIACGLLLTSCAGTEQAAGSDKAGGDADPVVLTMADAYSGFHYEPAVGYFVDRVADLSDGSLVIETTHEWGAFAADMEQQVLSDVAAGEVDVGWVGTRVFDTVGVQAFRALTAPMLIDSYPLQQAVIASDIPGEMMAELDTVGVTGIAVLADGLRKPISAEHPLVSPANFEGITFESFRSTTQADAIRALGAEPIDSWSIAGDDPNRSTPEGIEKNLHIHMVNGAQYIWPYVAANVNLWPQTVALIANPDTLGELTDTQRQWLMQAGADAAERSTALADRDAELVVQLCADGARFANASDADLEAFRQAFAPVFTALAEEPQTADFIARITELKETTDPGPALDIPADCSGSSPLDLPAEASADSVSDTNSSEPGAEALEGVYRWTVTEEDARANGDARLVSADFLPWYPMIGTLTLADGTWELSWRGGDGAEATDGPGTYSVTGNQITLENPADLPVTFTFSVDADGNIDVEPDPSMQQDAQFVFAHYQWELLEGDGASPSEPTGSETVNGTYRWTLTVEDVEEHGPAEAQSPESLAWYPNVTTVVLHDGRWTMVVRSDDQESRECDTDDCTYTIDGDRIVFNWRDSLLEFTFTTDEDGTLQLQPAAPMNLGDVFVWTTKPWERID